MGDEKTATVAIGRRTANAPMEIVERRLSGEDPRVVWSPDSRWLALTVLDGDGDVGGRRQHRRAPPSARRSFCGDDSSGFEWAPSGDRLAISQGASGTGCALYDLTLSVLGVDGSGGVIAGNVRGVPSWSEDGRWIAISGRRTEVMRADGSQRRRVGGSGEAAWSPHGTLAVAGLDPDAIRVGAPGGTLSTWERRVGQGPGPRFSPDGSMLAYQRRDDLLIRRVDDRSLVAQVHIADFAFVHRMWWSADGRSLYFDASGD